jgi:hypothetical protein
MALLIASMWTVSVGAGTLFRLEVGPPVAAGDGAGKLKGAVLVARAVVCDDLTKAVVTAAAEGLIDGRRQSIPLHLMALPTPGVYAVMRDWPANGTWVVHLSGTCPAPKAQASTLVPVDSYTFNRSKTQILTKPATRAQVEAALADLQRSRS